MSASFHSSSDSNAVLERMSSLAGTCKAPTLPRANSSCGRAKKSSNVSAMQLNRAENSVKLSEFQSSNMNNNVNKCNRLLDSSSSHQSRLSTYEQAIVDNKSYSKEKPPISGGALIQSSEVFCNQSSEKSPFLDKQFSLPTESSKITTQSSESFSKVLSPENDANVNRFSNQDSTPDAPPSIADIVRNPGKYLHIFFCDEVLEILSVNPEE